MVSFLLDSTSSHGFGSRLTNDDGDRWGHSFIIFLGDGFLPLNVLNALKSVPEVCRIFCATANPTEVVLTETDTGRGILGVVDGFSPKGAEDEGQIKWRKEFLRQIGVQAVKHFR